MEEGTEKKTQTLPELFESGLQAYRSPTLLNSRTPAGKWQSISADQAAERIRMIALGFSSLGVGRGERVVILSENRPEWTLVDLGLLSLGAVVVPIYTTQPASQIAFILRDAQPLLLVISNRALYERALPALEALGFLDKIVTFQTVPPIPRSRTLDEVEDAGRGLSAANPELFTELRGQVTAEDLASIIYTSDASGTPKGVMLTHRNFVSNVLACAELFLMRSGEDVALSYLPLSHVFERNILYHYLHRQISIYYVDSVEHVADHLVKVKPTIMTTVPRLLEKVEERMIAQARKFPLLGKMIFNMCMKVAARYDPESSSPFFYRIAYKLAGLAVYGRLRKRFGGRLRAVISGGARLRPELARLFSAAGIAVYQGYGLTETSPVISTNHPGRNRIGSVGPVIPGVTVRIAEDGEICVKGPNVMKGYYQNDEANRRVFEDGWFKTGDVGFIDPDGYLFVTDRKKDLMKTSGGKYVVPQVIEDLLAKNELVEKGVAIADGRKFVSALIFPNMEKLKELAHSKNLRNSSCEAMVEDPRIKAIYEGIVEEVNRHLSHWESIRKFAVVCGSAALTPEESKLAPRQRRKSLEKRYQRIVEGFYAHARGDGGAGGE